MSQWQQIKIFQQGEGETTQHFEDRINGWLDTLYDEDRALMGPPQVASRGIGEEDNTTRLIVIYTELISTLDDEDGDDGDPVEAESEAGAEVVQLPDRERVAA